MRKKAAGLKADVEVTIRQDYRLPLKALMYSGFLLGRDGGGSVTVRVVDQSVEGLIHPLPEHHSRNCPTNRQL